MKLFNSNLYVLLIVFVALQVTSQNYAKKIVSSVWYCNCDFKTDSLNLYPANTANYKWRLSFSKDGKLELLDLQKKTSNRSYSYDAKKANLKLFYKTNDSLSAQHYLIKRNKETQSYELKAYYEMRFKKKKPNDLPPVNTFTLSKGKKSVDFESMEEITVFRTKKGLKHDSIEVISKGHFMEIRNDTLVLNAYQFSEHNFYKKYPDTNHYFSETLFDTLIRIKTPLKEITKIYSQRDEFNRVVNTAAITALGVFFVSFPLAITVESSELGSTLGQVAAFSALSIPVIVSFNMIFSKRKFQISPTQKNKEVWQLRYK